MHITFTPTAEADLPALLALGYRTFRLLVATDYSHVVRVYEQCGFTRVGRIHLWEQDFFQYECS